MPGLSNDRSFPERHTPEAYARLEAFRKDLLSGEEFQKALAHPHAIDFLCHLDMRDSSCRDLVQKTLCVEGAIGTLVHGTGNNPYQQEKLAFLIENRLPKQHVQIFWQPWTFHDLLIFGLTDRYLKIFQNMRDPDDAKVLCVDGALQGLVASKISQRPSRRWIACDRARGRNACNEPS